MLLRKYREIPIALLVADRFREIFRHKGQTQAQDTGNRNRHITDINKRKNTDSPIATASRQMEDTE